MIECFAFGPFTGFLLGLFAVVTLLFLSLFHFLLRSEKEDESFMTLYTLTAKSRGSAEVRVLFLRVLPRVLVQVNVTVVSTTRMSGE